MAGIGDAETTDPDVNFGKRRPEMAPEKKRVPTDPDEYIPIGMRSTRRMRSDVWRYVWMSFSSILLLTAAFVILAYRIRAHGSP